MTCDNCGKDGAVVHLTHIEKNEMTTRHLCEACAADQGVEMGATGGSAPLTEFLAQIGKGLGGGASAESACPACGLTLADLRRTGRMGCAACYSHFDQHLRGLLRRLHGGTQHVGKVLAASEPSDGDRDTRLLRLRRSLERAVEAEDFEHAASLRDQIRRLETVD